MLITPSKNIARREDCKYYYSCLRQAALLERSHLPCTGCKNYRPIKNSIKAERVFSPASSDWGPSELPYEVIE